MKRFPQKTNTVGEYFDSFRARGEVLPAACKMTILVQSESAMARFRRLFGATYGFDMALSLRRT